MSHKPLTEKELAEVEARANAATPGPWRSYRDGNQFIETGYPPAAKLVAASRVLGPVRPWNPSALITFGFKPEEYETVRFLDADADFVAASRTDVPHLVDDLRAARAALRDIAERTDTPDGDGYVPVPFAAIVAARAQLPPEDR